MPEIITNFVTLVAFIAILGVLVFIHELGHYLAARWMGVHVEEFAFGFGKSLWQKQIGKTLYRINLLPFGGYVKLQGEKFDIADQREDSYTHKPIWAKLIILCAGVFMNVVLAVLLFIGYLASTGYQQAFRAVTDFDFVGAQNVQLGVVVSNVEVGSPADTNFALGDVILTVNGKKLNKLAEFKQVLANSEGENVTFEYINIDNLQAAPQTKSLNLRSASENKPLLGIGYVSMFIVDYPVSALSAFAHTWNMFSYQLTALGALISESIAKQDAQIALQEVGGVIAVGNLVGQVVSLGDYWGLINLTALLSVVLAFFNILPIPLLDGGQVMLETVQSVFRRRIPEGVVNVINTLSFLLLVGFSIFITFKDALQFNLVGGIFEALRSVLGR